MTNCTTKIPDMPRTDKGEIRGWRCYEHTCEECGSYWLGKWDNTICSDGGSHPYSLYCNGVEIDIYSKVSDMRADFGISWLRHECRSKDETPDYLTATLGDGDTT